MMDCWYFYRRGQKTGPVEFHDLQILAANDELAPDDRVWNERMPKWLPAGQVPGLFSRPGESPPQPRSFIQEPIRVSESNPLETLAASVPRSAESSPVAKLEARAAGNSMLVVGILIGLGFAGVAGVTFWLGTSNQRRADAITFPTANAPAQAPEQAHEATKSGPSAERLAHLNTYTSYNAELKKLKVRLQNGISYQAFCDRCDAISDAYSGIDDSGSNLKRIVDSDMAPRANLGLCREIWSDAVRLGVDPQISKMLSYESKSIDRYLEEYNNDLAGNPPPPPSK